MKAYTNAPRKPMMYGGMSTNPTKRKKMQSGGRVSDVDKRMAADAAANSDLQSCGASSSRP
jgi:hypothetical protein